MDHDKGLKTLNTYLGHNLDYSARECVYLYRYLCTYISMLV